MEEFAQKVFIREIEHQCRHADFTFHEMKHALDDLEKKIGASQLPGPWMSELMDRIFFTAHAFLVAAGNVSKLLWPTKRRCEARGKELRRLLGVDDKNVLNSRTFRNYFEHFDEHLDEWANSSKHKSFIDRNVGVVESSPGLNPEDCMRNLDPKSLTLTFHGESYHIPTIMDALDSIHSTAQRIA